ncbi:hypothetical protein D4M64_15290 [Enterococcus gallinarum]|nr:hypothetical protein D4M64_15290 [Enterococcus gallinarum]
MFLKQIQTYAVIHMQNQVLRKLVKLHSFQNVNILYISTFKTLSNYLESVFFLYLEHILEHIN